MVKNVNYFVSFIALDKNIFTFDWNKQNNDQKQLMTHFPFRSFPWAFFCSDFSFSLLSTLPTQYVATAVRSLSSEAGVRTWDLSYLQKNQYKSCFCNFEFRNFKCLTKIHYTFIAYWVQYILIVLLIKWTKYMFINAG